MRHFLEKFTCTFDNRKYLGAVEVVLVLQMHAAEVVVVAEKVVAAAGVGVTYGDNHNQNTAPFIIHQYTVHGTSCPPYAVPAFFTEIEIMKTKAQERYGNTSEMKIFLHKLEKRNTSES
jgi:hypothetical protein